MVQHFNDLGGLGGDTLVHEKIKNSKRLMLVRRTIDPPTGKTVQPTVTATAVQAADGGNSGLAHLEARLSQQANKFDLPGCRDEQ